MRLRTHGHDHEFKQTNFSVCSLFHCVICLVLLSLNSFFV